MIQINIKNMFGDSDFGRPEGLKLRLFFEDNWDKTDIFEVDFQLTKIASVSFFDEAFAKLANKATMEELRKKVSIINLGDFDKRLLNDVVKDRYSNKGNKAG